MTGKKCVFCNYNSIKEEVLWESDNFYVKIGIGIFAPGHVMMVSKKHTSCFGELPKHLVKEFIFFKEKIFNLIKSNFSEPIIYEHGIYGQTVKHAHIHFLPFKTNLFILENIGKKIFTSLKSTQIDNIFQMINIFERDGSYIYLEENSKKQIFHTKGLQEGYNFRKEIARLTGLHGLARWQSIDEEEKQRNNEWVKTTKEILKKDVKF